MSKSKRPGKFERTLEPLANKALRHAEERGDISKMQQLIDANPRQAKRLASWFVFHAPIIRHGTTILEMQRNWQDKTFLYTT